MTARRPACVGCNAGWGRLLPQLRPAWATLGPVRPEVAARTGLSRTVRVVNGIHDSSANLYRYQAAGLSGMTVVSTGTWIVAAYVVVATPSDSLYVKESVPTKKEVGV